MRRMTLTRSLAASQPRSPAFSHSRILAFLHSRILANFALRLLCNPNTTSMKIAGLIQQGRIRTDKAVAARRVPEHVYDNFRLIFQSRTISDGSSSKQFKSKCTQKRCTKLRILNANALNAWIIAYPQSVWCGGRMTGGTFKVMVERIDTSQDLTWLIRPALDELMENDLQMSASYKACFTSE